MFAPSASAQFLADDPGCLVMASLACACCLGSDVEWTLEGEGYDPSVSIVCRECGDEREVFLTPEQALRLSLHVTCPLDSAPRLPGIGLAI
jgi:hypothetical protein